MLKLFHFLALFGYLNMLCYEVRFDGLLYASPVEANETLLEFVFEEVFDLDDGDQQHFIPEIFYDEYQIFHSFFGIIPAVLIFAWLLSMIFLLLKTIPAYTRRRNRLENRPLYYTFLYRYRPF